MTPLYEDLQLALMQERDIRELAILDPVLINRARDRINALPAEHERGVLVDLMVDLEALRIHKIMGMAHRDLTRNQPPDLEGAQEPEIELYHATQAALQRCADLLDVDLKGDGE